MNRQRRLHGANRWTCENVADSSRGNGGVWTKTDFPQGHEPADALSNVSARQRRSGDVLDIRLEAKLVELLPPGELVPPRVAAHLATVAFPVSEHLESSQPPRRVDSRGWGPASDATACFCAGLSARITASNRSAAGKRDFCACSIERYSAPTPHQAFADCPRHLGRHRGDGTSCRG
jgi:hypothetical protein